MATATAFLLAATGTQWVLATTASVAMALTLELAATVVQHWRQGIL